MNKLNWNLKKALLLTFILLASLPILIVGFGSMKYLSNSMEQEVSEKNLLLANAYASELDRILDNAQNRLLSVVRLLEDEELYRPEKLNEYLASQVTSQDDLKIVYILDQQGVVAHLAPYDSNIDGLDMSRQAYFAAAKAQQSAYWSHIFISPQTGESSLVLAVPFKDGMVIGHLSLLAVYEVIDSIQMAPGGYVSVVDERGTTIAHHHQELVAQRANQGNRDHIAEGLQGRTGNFQYEIDGEHWIGSVAVVSKTHWVVAVSQTLDQILTPIRNLQLFFFLTLFGAVLTAVIVASFSLRRLLSPLLRLTRNARNIADGNYDIEAPPSSFTEIETLNESFRTMIQEVKMRETSLLASEERFRATFEQAAVGIAHVSPEGSFLRINQKFCDIVGYPPDEMENLTFQDITYPDDLEADLELLQQLLDGHANTYSTEKRYIRKGGRLVWANLTVSVVRNEAGEPDYFVSVIQDITERKQTEEALWESESLLKAAQKTAHIGSYSGDFISKKGSWSDEQYRIFGYAPGEIEPSFETTLHHVHPEDRQKWLKANQEFIQEKIPYHLEYRIIRKDGAVRTILAWAILKMNDAGVPTRTVGLTQDITERKLADEALRESEKKFRNLVAQSPISIQIHDVEGRFMLSNAAHAKLYAISEDRQQEVYEKYNVRDDEQARDLGLAPLIERVYAGEVVQFPSYEYDGVDTLKTLNFNHPISRKCFIKTQAFPLKDEQGMVTAAVFMSEDISEQKQAEEALKESGELFSKAFYEQPLAMQIVNFKTGERMDTNAAMCELTGYSKEEFEAEGTYTHGLWLDPEAQKQGGDRLIKERITRNLPTDIQSKDGQVKHLILNASMLDIGDGNVGIVSAIDVTESKKAQEALAAYQVRLRALASELTLTEERERRRIATELHDGAAQSLAYARLQLTSALKRVDDTQVANKLDDLSLLLKESLQQIRGVLLDLSSPALNQIGLAAALGEWLEEQVERRHGIRTAFTHACPDDLELHDDMLAMLFRNARELLSNIIKHADAKQVSVDMRCDETNLYISIQDDGHGFDPDRVAKRPSSTGGFGLFSVRERMSDMGGTLDIHSEHGKGCTSLLSLPLQRSLKGKRS